MLSILFVVAAAVPAMATDARQQSLAGTGNYIEDDYNIFTWYATLPSYGNTVWMGLQYMDYYMDGEGSNFMKYIGASYNLGEEGKFGTVAMFLYDMAPGLNPFGYSYDDDLWPGAGLFGDGLYNKFTLLYGYPMEKLAIGFYFNRSDRAYEDVVNDEIEEGHQAYTTIGVGLRFDLGEKAYMDVAGDVSFVTYKETDTPYGEIEADANKMFGGRARMFYEWNETITWVPYVNFRMFDFSLKAEEEGLEDFGDKAMGFDLGLGANIKVNEDNLLIFAVEPYSTVKREPSEPPDGTSGDITVTAMPRIFLALESDVRDWLTFRVGGMKELLKDKETYEETDVTEEEYTSTWSEFAYYMGLGFHVSDFDIDCVINNELPFNMGYWLTGKSYSASYYDNGQWQPVYMVSAAYHF